MLLLPAPRPGICYTGKQLTTMGSKFSRLKPVEPGDLCCHCGADCDGEGFASGLQTAARINGHPICARPSCYIARLSEYGGHRHACKCRLQKA
jgi:hypothetical protein